ncbi:hypothetical protein ES708_06684 [subsurface metagenome]
MGDVQEKRPIPVRFDKGQGFFGNGCYVVGIGFRVAVTLRFVCDQVFVKALLVRIVRFAGWRPLGAAQVPLAETCRSISQFFQRFRQCLLVERQIFLPLRSFQSGVGIGIAGNEISEVETGRVFSRHDAGAGGRTDGTGGIGRGELHALACQPFQVWRAIIGTAVRAALAPAHVIGEDEQEVRSGGNLLPGQAGTAAGCGCGPYAG